MELLQDTHVWLGFSFATFILLVVVFARKAIVNVLDTRIAKISAEISEAQTLHAEAKALLDEYQAKQRDAVKEAEKIIANAEISAVQHRKQAEAELAEYMQRREKQLGDRLARMKQNAIAEIQAYAADLATRATAEIIAEKLDKKTNEKLVERAISNIGDSLN